MQSEHCKMIAAHWREEFPVSRGSGHQGGEDNDLISSDLRRFQLRMNRWNRCNCLFLRIIRTHRSRKRNQSGELISLRRRFALLLEML